MNFSSIAMYLSLMYITDWMATLLTAAGLKKLIPPRLDSYNMWPVLSKGKKSWSPRQEIILNLDKDIQHGTRSLAILYVQFVQKIFDNFVLSTLSGQATTSFFWVKALFSRKR